MKRMLYALACAMLVTIACGTSSIAPTLDPNELQTVIASTALAAQNQTQMASAPNKPLATNRPVATSTPSPTRTPLPIPTTTYGSLANPFPYNVPAHLYLTSNGDTMYFILSINKTIRGSMAWNLIQVANQFNKAPPSGMEPILIQLTISDVTGSGTLSLNNLDFAVVSNGRMTKDMDYSSFFVSGLEKFQMDKLSNVTLLAGGNATGWIVSLESVGDTNSLLVFDPSLLLGMNTASSSLYFTLPPGSSPSNQ